MLNSISRWVSDVDILYRISLRRSVMGKKWIIEEVDETPEPAPEERSVIGKIADAFSNSMLFGNGGASNESPKNCGDGPVQDRSNWTGN